MKQVAVKPIQKSESCNKFFRIHASNIKYADNLVLQAKEDETLQNMFDYSWKQDEMEWKSKPASVVLPALYEIYDCRY